MALTIPLENQTWPKFRILTREGFGAGTGSADDQRKSGGGWVVQPMLRRDKGKHGFEVIFFERCAFPQVGRATVRYRYGLFDTGLVGGEWTDTDGLLDIPDLAGQEIRIQAAPAPENDTDAVTGWRTVYWGTIDSVEDRMSPGAPIPRGDRYLHAVDGFYRTSRWAMDHHGAEVQYGGSISLFGHVRGHPGYNFNRNRDSVTAGNRSSSQYQAPSGLQVNYHTPTGGGSKWTDAQAAENAMHGAKPPGEPKFTLVGSTDLLAGENSWEIREGENVHAFAMRLLRRERGKGLVFVDWADDTSAPDGPLTVFLTLNSQVALDILYVDPATGADVTVQGADLRGTTVAVDLIGDHRNVADAFQLGDPDQYRFGYLETLGEPIEVLATLAYEDGRTGTVNGYDGAAVVRGWSAAHQTTFRAFAGATLANRQEARHRPVYQQHFFNPRWQGLGGDGNGGATVPMHRIDYRCTDAGYIRTPETLTPAEAREPENGAATSPLLVDVLEDLPLCEGYQYTDTLPARVDTATETISPARRKIVGYVRISANRYLDFDQTASGSVVISVDGNAVWAVHSGDEGAGTRFFSDTGLSGASAVYNYEKLVFTVGLRLPHRVRLATGDSDHRRKVNVNLPGLHLWVASPGAIHDLDTATGSASLGFAGRRGACSGSVSGGPGILRDDRSALARAHHLAWAWYGTDSSHRTASWTLNACGFLLSFAARPGLNVTTGDVEPYGYPTIGKVVSTLAANGQTFTLNTPITRIAYDNEAGTTTWATEWQELSFDG